MTTIWIGTYLYLIKPVVAERPRNGPASRAALIESGLADVVNVVVVQHLQQRCDIDFATNHRAVPPHLMTQLETVANDVSNELQFTALSREFVRGGRAHCLRVLAFLLDTAEEGWIAHAKVVAVKNVINFELPCRATLTAHCHALPSVIYCPRLVCAVQFCVAIDSVQYFSVPVPMTCRRYLQIVRGLVSLWIWRTCSYEGPIVNGDSQQRINARGTSTTMQQVSTML